MAEITLADYTGYIFLEIIKARQMADAYSRQVAEVYAQDPILQHFSVPRFKVPKMELTIPVLISGTRFNQVMRFNMEEEDFTAYIQGLVDNTLSTVRRAFRPILKPVVPPAPVIPASSSQLPELMRARELSSTLGHQVHNFWMLLRDNPDPSQPVHIVTEMWEHIFGLALAEAKLEEVYKKHYPKNELFHTTLEQLLEKVETNTVVDNTQIQSLLVNPETNVVKNGSSEASVFTIKAEMREEGLFIRCVKDEKTGEMHPVVEFE